MSFMTSLKKIRRKKRMIQNSLLSVLNNPCFKIKVFLIILKHIYFRSSDLYASNQFYNNIIYRGQITQNNFKKKKIRKKLSWPQWRLLWSNFEFSEQIRVLVKHPIFFIWKLDYNFGNVISFLLMTFNIHQ